MTHYEIIEKYGKHTYIYAAPLGKEEDGSLLYYTDTEIFWGSSCLDPNIDNFTTIVNWETFWVILDWEDKENNYQEKNKCTCSLLDILTNGCKKGHK